MSAENVLLLKKPEVQERLVKIRDSTECSTWQDVLTKFNEEYESNVSMTALRTAYNKAQATSITISGPAQQKFGDFFDGMSKRLERIQTTTDLMQKWLEDTIRFYESSCDLSDIERHEKIMELSPKLDKISTTIMKQLNFVSNQMEQVTLEQQKMVWDSNRLKEEMDKLQPIRLQILEDEGEIAIINRGLLLNK